MRDSVKFCSKCSEWLCQECLRNHFAFKGQHKHLSDEACECIGNQKPFSLYCKNCLEEICSDCKGLHKYHQLIPFESIHYEDHKENAFNDIKTKNRQYINKLIERIEERQKLIGKNDNYESNRLNSMKKSIQSALKVNELINEDLELLYYCFRKTALAYEMESPDELLMQQAISINKEHLIDPKDTIEEEVISLRKHLLTTFVLKQTPTNEPLGQLERHKAVVCCLLQLKDGKLASGSSYTTILLWNTATNECTQI